MAFDLDVFRNKFISGGARTSQFEVQLTWPQIVPNGVAAAAAAPFLCSGATLPESQVQELAVFYFGRQLKYAGQRLFQNMTISVLNDEDFAVRAAFEAWSAAIQAHTTSISQFPGGLTSDSYATDIQVLQYSRNDGGDGGVPIRAYSLVGAWPTQIHAIRLSWAEEGVETYEVDLAYQWWQPIDPTSGQPDASF